MLRLNLKLKRTLVLVVGIGVLGSGVWVGEWFFHREETLVFAEEPAGPANPRGQGTEPDRATIAVHVSGAVEHPGLYTLLEGSRVDEAVRQAVLLEEADLFTVNLAAILQDGQKVHIPSEDERLEGGWDSGLVNVNTADEARLTTLSGVGPVTASAIVRHRQQNGPFLDKDDLLEVDGIGPARLAQIREQVTLY